MSMKAATAASLETVTDFVEEKNSADSAKTDEALAALAGEALVSTDAANTESSLIPKEKLSEESITLIVDELEVERVDAERALRASNGDVVKALRTLVTSP